jgi:hypothetical protein
VEKWISLLIVEIIKVPRPQAVWKTLWINQPLWKTLLFPIFSAISTGTFPNLMWKC